MLLTTALLSVILMAASCGSANHTSYFTKGQAISDNLAQLAAPGNKVYIEWVDAEGGLKTDEYDDFVRLTKGYTNWTPVDKKSNADFVLRLIQNKRWVLGSPSCWLTPEILTTGGQLVWRGKMTRGEATAFSGYRATDRCFKKMLDKVFLKVPGLAPGVKAQEL
ncbi:MAG: hypothetical protein K6G79_01470 [Bacteroidales bacterium]|nr:hypothetical protein [Bacteroidales bacterium]